MKRSILSIAGGAGDQLSSTTDGDGNGNDESVPSNAKLPALANSSAGEPSVATSEDRDGFIFATMMKVAIIDLQGSYAPLIDREIRRQGYRSDIFAEVKYDILDQGNYKAILFLSSGFLTGNEPQISTVLCWRDNQLVSKAVPATKLGGCPGTDPDIFSGSIPILGLGEGFHYINEIFGGSSARLFVGNNDEASRVVTDRNCPLFVGVSSSEYVYLPKSPCVTSESVAPNMSVISTNHINGYVAGVSDERRQLYALQFHPDHDLTPCGSQIFHNFLTNMCGIPKNYDIDRREEEALAHIKRALKNKKLALVFITGGLRSVMAYKMIEKAVGESRVFGIYLTTGFNRYEERSQVVSNLQKFSCQFTTFDISEICMNARYTLSDGTDLWLPTATDGDQKRLLLKICFEKAKRGIMQKLKLSDNDVCVAQMSLRSNDLMLDFNPKERIVDPSSESIVNVRHTSEVYPLRTFYREELAELSLNYGLGDALVHSHPFPSTGLLNRIICPDGPAIDSNYEVLQDNIALLCELLRGGARICNDGDNRQRLFVVVPPELDGAIARLSSYDHDFLLTEVLDVEAVLVPLKVPGYVDGRRVLGYVVVLSVDETDVPWDDVLFCARVIPTMFPEVTRVVFAFGPRILYSMEDLTDCGVTESTVRKLQYADAVAHSILAGKHLDGQPYPGLGDCLTNITAMPVILIPCNFCKPEIDFPTRLWSVVLRPVKAYRSTVKPAIPGDDLPEPTVMTMAERIKATVPFISRVLYDLTPCPDGIVEWE